MVFNFGGEVSTKTKWYNNNTKAKSFNLSMNWRSIRRAPRQLSLGPQLLVNELSFTLAYSSLQTLLDIGREINMLIWFGLITNFALNWQQ